jgi:RNA polymerase sigma-70 factor (ECF subfamily)
MPAGPQDAERFRRHVLPLAGQIRASAARLTRTPQDAEDLTQEVMLRAYAGLGSFRDGTNTKAWLYRILHNTWISQYRKAKCRPEEVPVERICELASGLVPVSKATRSAEDSALESISDDDLRAALAALHEEVRTTVYYADVLQFTCKEIAVITDCPIGTVSSRLFRGRKQLRASLSPTAVGHFRAA